MQGVEWQEWIKVGPIALEFPLTVTGVEVGLDAALKRLAQDDTEGTVATVRSIKDERRRAAAQVVLTAAMFEQVVARQH